MVLSYFQQLGIQRQVTITSRSQSLSQIIQSIVKSTFGLLRSVGELKRLSDAKPWLLLWV